jgi:hypothetical protein
MRTSNKDIMMMMMYPMIGADNKSQAVEPASTPFRLPISLMQEMADAAQSFPLASKGLL